ncbi:MAG: tetratricopeptide repeat protein [Sandaracinaceae bacterium]|nr:tetratricopeptide repeat protein [Sandaracinaceae bacterium]
MNTSTVCAYLAVFALASCGGASEESILRSQREYDLAVGLYGEQDTAGAFEHLLEAIELDPDNADAHLLLGNLFMINRQDYQQAEHHMREAIRANEAVEARTGLPSEARNALGVLYNNAQRYEEAAVILEEASADLMNRHQPLTWANLAWAYRELGRLDEALQIGRQAVQRDPNHCIALFRLSEVHVALDQQEQAQQRLDHLLGLEDATCQRIQAGWRLRGEVRAHLGDRPGAIADLERCVELSAETDDGQACQRLLQGQGAAENEAPDPAPEATP